MSLRQPFYRSQTKSWYFVDAAGKFVRLSKDKREAFTLWHNLQANPKVVGPAPTFMRVVDVWLIEHGPPVLTQAQYDKAYRLLESFIAFVGPDKKAAAVTPRDVLRWLDEPKVQPLRKDKTRRPSVVWSGYMRTDAAAAVRRVFRWAYPNHLQCNPLANLRIEGGRPRSRLVTPEEHATMLQDCFARAGKRYHDRRQLGHVLIALRGGARPSQVRELQVRDIGECGAAWVFDQHKTAKKTGKPLVVYLPPCLQTLTRILAAGKAPDAHLFTNSRGDPWKKDTLNQKFRRCRERAGVSSDITPYCYRHTFATDALRAGVSMAGVAALLGHQSTELVSRVYGHLDQHAQHLVTAATKISQSRLTKR